MAENKLTLLESVELVGEGVSIPDLSPEDLVIRPQAGVADYTLVDAIDSGNRWRERFKAQCDEIVEKHKDVLDFEEEDRFKGNKPAVAEKPVKIEGNKLAEALISSPNLKLDEITPFFEMCDRLGIETLGDFERFMKEYGRDKDPITALKDYFIDELEDLDFRAKKESLTESISDGWPENLQDFDFFQTIDRLAYEIRSAYRGAYTKAETYEELADYLENNVAAELEYVIDYLRNETEDVEPLEESVGVSSERSLDREFVELPSFKNSWKALDLSEKYLRNLQNQILNHPEQGIALGSNVYKFRFSPDSTNQGKSGSHRVLYIDIIKDSKIYLVMAFNKSDEENISPKELEGIRALAKEV